MPLDNLAVSSAFILLLAACPTGWAQDGEDDVMVVAQDGTGDFNGADETPISQAIDAVADTGGTIRIKAGRYLIRRKITPASNITITGTPDTVLRLPSPTVTTARVEAGSDIMAVADSSRFSGGTTAQVCPPEGLETFPGTDAGPTKIDIAGVEPGKLHLARPVPHAVPSNSRIGYANNVFEIRKPEQDVTIENLVIDGGRRAAIEMPGHVERCAVLAHASYSYEKGPTGPPIRDLRVVNCRIRNCYGRAVAMYSVVRGLVEGCYIWGIADEAIDFDHFCYHCRAVGNEVQDAVTGVTINDGSYCTVEYNRFTDCGVGVTIWWWHMCPQEDIDVENVIRHNFIFAPKRAGISIGQRCFRNQVTANFVEGGIEIAEPDNVAENNTLW